MHSRHKLRAEFLNIDVSGIIEESDREQASLEEAFQSVGYSSSKERDPSNDHNYLKLRNRKGKGKR